MHRAPELPTSRVLSTIEVPRTLVAAAAAVRIAVAEPNVERIYRMEQEEGVASRNTRAQRAPTLVEATVPTVTRSNKTNNMIKPVVGTQEVVEAAFKEAAFPGGDETVRRHIRPAITKVYKEAGCLVPDRICSLSSEHCAV